MNEIKVKNWMVWAGIFLVAIVGGLLSSSIGVGIGLVSLLGMGYLLLRQKSH